MPHAARQPRSWLIFDVGQKMKVLPILLVAIILTGCGPFVSGTWSDDPKNWKRAFGEPRPKDGITVVRSWYMRTPHFTAEFAWFFALELSDNMKKDLIENPGLSKVSIASPEDLRSRIYQNHPSWFSPEPLSNFEVYESRVDRDFLIFVEKGGGRSFWTRFQL
jgi:hypothetical protein